MFQQSNTHGRILHCEAAGCHRREDSVTQSTRVSRIGGHIWPCCRFARHPSILARSVDALEAQLDGLAQLLGTNIQRAARLAFKVPALAAQTNEELKEHVDLLTDVSMCCCVTLVGSV